MQYYVYELADPRTGEVFYVGKGQRDRIAQHEVEARKGKTSKKCDMIRDIWSGDQQVERRIVKRFKTDIEALAFEAEHVKAVGRENLTNMRDGGHAGRVKFGRVVLLEEADTIVVCLKQWIIRGSVERLNLGTAVMELKPIVDKWRQRLAEIAEATSIDDVAEVGKKHNVRLEFV